MIDNKNVTKIAFFVIGAIILFTFLGSLLPEYSDMTQEIYERGCTWNGSEYIDCQETPLSGMFHTDGLIFLLIMVGILIAIVKTVLTKK